MNVAVCIPWFDSGDPHRRAAFEAVRSFMAGSEWPLHVSTYATERATARNEAAYAALAAGHDLLLLNDADTLCLGEHLEQAVAEAARAPGLVFAYDLYCRLTREATETLVADPMGEWPLVFERQYYGPPSIGCVALSAETFLQTGGLDERFRGWGYEDLAFVDACQEVAPARRIPGPAFHLWHGDRPFNPFAHGDTLVDAPADADPEQARVNRARWLGHRDRLPA
jgi:hypothetical protein